MYTHTQAGWLVRIATTPILLVALYIASVRGGDAWLAIPTLGFYGLIVVLFGSLTVTVDDTHVRAAFGIGWVHKKFALADIEAVEPVRNPWYYFWGIRYYGRGMLYNISGLDAVRIQLAEGREARIGTDEPTALAAAIQAAVPGQAPTA
ncbi:MAG: hypothetical protein GKS06_06210 [Acidobacteria bacterium]|nr:hypothetical protein [Acidobacteriota bacterium]